MSTAGKSLPCPNNDLIPHLVIDGCAKALDFYKNAFGAVEMCRMPMPGGDKIMHAAMTIEGKKIMLADDFPDFCGGKASSPTVLGGSSVTIHRYVSRLRCRDGQVRKGGGHGQDARRRDVLGRPLRRGDRSVRPHLGLRHAHQRPHARADDGRCERVLCECVSRLSLRESVPAFL